MFGFQNNKNIVLFKQKCKHVLDACLDYSLLHQPPCDDLSIQNRDSQNLGMQPNCFFFHRKKRQKSNLFYMEYPIRKSKVAVTHKKKGAFEKPVFCY